MASIYAGHLVWHGLLAIAKLSMFTAKTHPEMRPLAIPYTCNLLRLDDVRFGCMWFGRKKIGLLKYREHNVSLSSKQNCKISP